jgi:hypothetical protein
VKKRKRERKIGRSTARSGGDPTLSGLSDLPFFSRTGALFREIAITGQSVPARIGMRQGRTGADEILAIGGAGVTTRTVVVPERCSSGELVDDLAEEPEIGRAHERIAG